ncbi:MAG TPA: hypothetical protein VGS27_00005, partial [Candidatus Sulfotelmatobacter sp.]|nr:hypothetical protein [Candidatus Sulfotelmatobacter sp.]
AVVLFHPIAGRWRPACLRAATVSVETVSPPLVLTRLYFNTDVKWALAGIGEIKSGQECNIEQTLRHVTS